MPCKRTVILQPFPYLLSYLLVIPSISIEHDTIPINPNILDCYSFHKCPYWIPLLNLFQKRLVEEALFHGQPFQGFTHINMQFKVQVNERHNPCFSCSTTFPKPMNYSFRSLKITHNTILINIVTCLSFLFIDYKNFMLVAQMNPKSFFSFNFNHTFLHFRLKVWDRMGFHF